MPALPADAYRDPCDVVADAERGDVMPQRRVSGDHCGHCRHHRDPVGAEGRRWHCERGCMPGAGGRCAEWSR